MFRLFKSIFPSASPRLRGKSLNSNNFSMFKNRLGILSFILILCAACPCFLPGAENSTHLTEDQIILQILNRLTFGPKPGDLERVKKMGVQAFLDEQLSPEKLTDTVCEADLKRCTTINETIDSLLMEYPQPGQNIMRPDLRNVILSPRAQEDAYGRIYGMVIDLSSAKLTRMVESRRQVYEVMADFWYNHFNVAFDKNEVQWLTTAYDRDVIRPHVLGKFKDILTAVAKSPAMLCYLDNNDNFADPNFKPVAQMSMNGKSPSMMMQPMPGQGLRINENYARELLELHTLGVDSGYTQKDIIETARVFTGWAVAGLQTDSGYQPVQFKFKAWHHDGNPKIILGQTFDQGGVAEGDAVLAMLAKRPETANRIAFKLCQRFVADNPPAALVKKVADKFLASDGDIKETLLALINSPEFTDPKYYRVKVKTPLEFVASTLRAVDVHPTDWSPAIRVLESMGQPLFRCEAPTGYPQTANAWVSSASLLGRTNFASQLFDYTENGREVFNQKPFEGGLQSSFKRLLNDEVSETTRQTLSKEEASLTPKKLAALVLASPDFQRR